MLTEKENFLMCLRGEQPEWVPQWSVMQLPDAPPSPNCVFVPPGVEPHRERWGGKDIWGVEYVGTESTANALLPVNSYFILPLEKLSQWHDIIKAPDFSGVDWEQAIAKQIAESRIDRTQTALTMNLHMGYFQQLMSFMGFEDGMMAFYEEPDTVHELLDYMSEFYMSVVDKVIDIYKPEMLMFMDDTASWQAPFISPAMYEEFILPHHAKLAKRGRERGLHMSMHNCGKSEAFMDLLVGIGINVWEPAQTCNDLKAIQAKYGNRLCLGCAWDAEGRLLEHMQDEEHPDGVTEEELRQSMRNTIDAYAVGGGFLWGAFILGAKDDEDSMNKNLILWDEGGKYARTFYQNH